MPRLEGGREAPGGCSNAGFAGLLGAAGLTDEASRLAALEALNAFGRPADPILDALTRVAARFAGTTMAAVALVGETQQWLMGSTGLGSQGSSRDDSFCAQAILEPGSPLIVPDATLDPRFVLNPFVVGDPHVRAYAGVPMIGSGGAALGAVCVIDTRPRTFGDDVLSLLHDLAQVAVEVLESRQDRARLMHTVAELDRKNREAATLDRQMARVLEHTPFGVVTVAVDGPMLNVNNHFASMLGYPTDEVVGRRVVDFVAPSDVDGVVEARARLVAGEIQSITREWSYVRRDGREVVALTSVSMVFDDDGTPLAMLGIVEDISARRRAESELVETQSSFDAILSTDDRGVVLSWNDGAVRMFGMRRDQMIGRDISAVRLRRRDGSRASWSAASDAASQLTGRVETFEMARADGTVFPVEASVTAWERGGQTYYTVVLRDMTEREAARAELERLSVTDRRTGLGNRHRLERLTDEALAGTAAVGSALLLLNLDHFRQTNESLGHDQGDQLLTQVAAAFEGVAGAWGEALRINGDEFALFMSAGTAPAGDEALKSLGHQLLRGIAGPFTVAGVPVSVEASLGMARLSAADCQEEPDPSRRMRVLLQRADTAMYRAKDYRDGALLWSPELEKTSLRQLQLLGDLRTAIPAGELRLHWQPLVPLAGGTMRAEALVRWQHPEHGLLYPVDFLPIAESTRLILPLTRWVLDEALAQRQRWLASGLDVAVGVNVSPRTFTREDVPTLVSQALAAHGCPPERLTLEITESALADDPGSAACVLAQLRALGVRLSLDDFGAGFTSLQTVREALLDELKIDKAFILNLAQRQPDQVIVRSLIEMAHGLGLTVVAEGVEDASSAELLFAAGCDHLQGYHFSRPVPPDVLPGVVASL